MRHLLVLFTLAAAATMSSSSEADLPARPVPPVAVPPQGPLPAGLCGFDAYLGSACTTAATFAVTLDAPDAATATTTLAAARAKTHAVGYPFASTYDELPARDPSKKGLVIVLGLFATEPEARALATAASAIVVPLATVEAKSQRDFAHAKAYATYDQSEASRRVAIELADDAPAFSLADVTALEDKWDAEPWIPIAKQVARRTAAVATLTPRCTVRRGQVFTPSRDRVFHFSRTWLPVTCADGAEAWVSERVTRFESVVTKDSQFHQVIGVDCDVPTTETRAFTTPLAPAPGTIAAGRCD